MTNDLETRIRASLAERAHDVEPTPELWRSVQKRTARQRFVPMVAWTAGLTAAAVTAFIVVPNVLDPTERSVSIEPLDDGLPPAAGTSEGQLAGLIPNRYVAAVGRDLVLRSVDDSQPDRVVLSSVDGPIVAVEVSPRATVDDLSLTYTVVTDDGRAVVRLARLIGGAVVSDTVVTVHDSIGEVAPQAIWSPTGDAVAWTSTDRLEGPRGLHIGTWDGTGIISESLSQVSDVTVPAGDLVLQDWNSSAEGSEIIAVAGGSAVAAEVSGGAEPDVTVWREFPTDRVMERLPRIIDVAVTPRATWIVSRDDRAVSVTSLMADGSGIGVGWDGVGRVTLTALGDGALIGADEHSAMAVLGPEERTGFWPWSGTSTMSSTPDIADTAAAAFIPVLEGAIPTDDQRLTGAFAGGADGGPANDAATEPAAAPDPVGATPYLGIDGRGRFVVGTEDEEIVVHAPAEPPNEAGLSPMDVAVRPGSTVDDLDAVVLYATEAGPEFHWLRVRDGGVTDERFPDAYQLGFDADLGHLQVPVWSPDGRSLAWVERSGTTSDWSLRTIGWEDGPGTGRTADDNASTALPLSAGDLVLSAWEWEIDGLAPDGADGHLLFSVDREALSAEPMALQLPIQRQGDGALAFGDAFEPIREEGAQIIDLERRGDRTDLLVRFADGTYGVELEGGRTVALDLDPESSPLTLDLDLVPGGVVVTQGGRGVSYVVSPEGVVRALGTGGGDPLTAYDRID